MKLYTYYYTIYLQEKRIYDLKKKNQELEKFKFVLDYKIKELKKQIEPRENDIKAMKEQIQEVGAHHPVPHCQNISVPIELSVTWGGIRPWFLSVIFQGYIGGMSL